MSLPNSRDHEVCHDSVKAFAILSHCGQGKETQLFLARQVIAAATALLPVAGAIFIFLFSTAASQAEGSSSACEEAAGLAVLSSPAAPWRGAPLRVLFAVEKPFDGELSLIAPNGSIAVKSHGRYGGPPYFWFAETASPAEGRWHATLTREGAPSGCGTITREITVLGHEPPRPHTGPGVWPLRDTW